MRSNPSIALARVSALVLVPALLVVAGCGGHVSALGGENAAISIHAAATRIDTNGSTRYSATLANGEPAKVEWSVAGGDPSAGPGKISADGVYTPPGYLTQEAVTVSVIAALAGGSTESDFARSDPGKSGSAKSVLARDTAELTVTPGFLQPLTPGNLTLGPNGTVTITGSMTEVGGGGGIRFALASDAHGTPSTAGSLSTPQCSRGSISGSNPAYTVCSVTYTAPASVAAAGSVFIVGAVSNAPIAGSVLSPTLSWTRVLLNPAGISSNPTGHQAHLAVPVQLGSSSSNNLDYDSSLGQLSDCCGGTLGALLQDTGGNQYVLSNNHVLARSDQSIPGETIIQPGLIDNGCTPYGFGPGTTPVATLTGYPLLSAPATNVDAAIARATPGAVDPKGNILELGAKQSDGTLAAAPPGISSTGGKGEAAGFGMMVAKSGRTTGLTCASVSAISVDVLVDYFTDCAETARSMTKTFTNQIAIAGTSFSDAGDSGSLIVDTANAEPVGLFFAGGTDVNGVEQAIANPISDVLATLDSQVPGTNGPTTYSLVGGVDHPVSCLSYGGQGPKIADESAGVISLSIAERERAEAALSVAQLLVNPATGIIRTGIIASKDHPGEAAVAIYVETMAANAPASASIPQTIGGVTTVVLPANGQPGESSATPAASQPRAASLIQALQVKQRNAAALLKSNPALFGVGVGQSLDNPSDAALILFVDRKKVAAKLPGSIEGQRVRIILMDRLHVTRSHGSPSQPAHGSCSLPLQIDRSADDGFEPTVSTSQTDQPGQLQKIFEDKLPLPE